MSFLDYDPRYREVFARVAGQVRAVLPDVGLDHVGSTAVPGLGGRGVLDLVVVAPVSENDRVLAALHALGWADAPFAWIKPMLTATVRYAGAAFPVLAYVLPPAHELRRGLLAAREKLRADPDEAARYAEVKQAALAAGQSTPWAYQQAKTPYLQELAGRAVADLQRD